MLFRAEDVLRYSVRTGKTYYWLYTLQVDVNSGVKNLFDSLSLMAKVFCVPFGTMCTEREAPSLEREKKRISVGSC